MKDFCPNCNDISSLEEVISNEKFFIKKEEIEVEVTLMKCLECGELFENGAQELSNYSIAVDAYREKHKLLTTSEIIALREKYGMSQRLLCRLFDWSPSLLCQYENGKIQDNAHNDLLEFINSPLAMLKYNINHRERLSPKEAKELSSIIKPLVEEEDNQNHIKGLTTQYINVDVAYTGEKYFNYDRIIPLVQYLASKVDDLSQTKLFKLLFYSDFYSYKVNKSSITGIPYCKYPHGPVPVEYRTFIDILRYSNKLKVEDQFDGDSPKIFIYNCEEVELSMYSKDEIDVIDKVIGKLKNKSAKQLSELSHKEVAYESAEDRTCLNFKYAENLKLNLEKI